MSYNGYIINGQRFRTKGSEKSRQNSGVSVKAEPYRSSAEDSNDVLGNVFYYGILQDIILLDYHTFRVPLFKCDLGLIFQMMSKGKMGLSWLTFMMGYTVRVMIILKCPVRVMIIQPKQLLINL